MGFKTLKFTGRSRELEKITQAWRKASDVKDPKPHIVLLKGERGVGKTRLAFEFYHWLNENNASNVNYWPDAIAIYKNAINVNPDPRECNFKAQMPYLWWGLHISDFKNPIDTISSYDSYLAPHLAVLLASSIRKRKGIDMASALADLGIDVGISLLEDLTYLGLIKRLAEGVKKGVDIVRGGINEISVEKALQVPQSRATSILEQLERVFNPNRDFASIPGVLLIDDAQDIDATKDPAILDFIERLFHKAINQKWPILILVTHWKRELSSEVTPQDLSFAGLLRHCLQTDSSVSGPAAGLPGGFLNESNFIELDLGPVDDLSVALDEQLPGLSREQSIGILNTTGGNPRFLEQLVYFAKENEGFFEDFDTSKSLSDSGYNELLLETKSQDIFRVVRRRLIGAPDDVKEAICLASLQGIRFANDLVKAVAQIQLSKDVQIPLEKAEDPYSWVAGVKNKEKDGIGTFVEQLFYQVAENVRPHLKSLGGELKLIGSFKETIQTLVQDEEFRNSGQLETQLIAYSIAADLFEKSGNPDELSLAQRAMSYVAMVHLKRNSLEAATAAYERLLKTPPSNNSWLLGNEWKDRISILDFLTASYRKLNWPSKASTAYKRMIWMGYHLIDDQKQRVFVFSRSPEEVRKTYDEWKREKLKNIQEGGYFDDMKTKPDSAFLEKRLEEDYFSSVSVIVKALLGLAELAFAWPSLKFDEGDDPIAEAPFMIMSYERDDDGLPGKRVELEGPEVFQILKERAYTLGTLIDENFAKHEYFKLLVDDIAQTNNGNGNFDSAIDALSRALNIAKEMDDLISQMIALNGLGVVYGRKEERIKCEDTLQEAGQILREQFNDKTFSAVVLSKGQDVEYKRLNNSSEIDRSRILRHLEIPVYFESSFDKDPKKTVNEFYKLIEISGDIESNLGLNLLSAGEYEKAANRLKYAMESYANLNDGPRIASTYRNLALIAKCQQDNKLECNYLHRSISVYEKLKKYDDKDGRDILWDNAIRELEILVEESGCEN